MSGGASPLANLTLADLDLTRDCRATGAALVAWPEVAQVNVPYDSLVDMVEASFEGGLDVPHGDIINWYLDTNGSLNSMRETLTEGCLVEYCQALGWEGNSDLAGIGVSDEPWNRTGRPANVKQVLSAYSIQVGITSFFILSSLFYSLVLKHPPRRMSIATMSDRPFFTALQSSLGIFWDTALLFALSVSIASIILTFTDRATYTQAFCALSAVLVTPPLIALWPFYVPACARPLPRRIALFVLCCVTFAMGLRHVLGQIFDDSAFEKRCYRFKEEQTAIVAKSCVFGATAYLGLGVPAWLAYHWTMFRDWRVLRRATAWKHRHRYMGGIFVDGMFVVFVGVIPFVFMWTTLGVFVRLRAEIADRAGDSIEEGKWGFGQILALITWVPTALDFVVVWWNSRDGLDYRLPAGLGVRDKSVGEDEGIEMMGQVAKARSMEVPRARTWAGYESVVGGRGGDVRVGNGKGSSSHESVVS
ncbi:hypothetical protein F5X68DRAFT_252896 [Plectosphaerella plurivora]|uniref:Uncharacterized protein n=1 Tax=Plectosphaerella plurivora TaxID=936078 RepID=A0A9P8V0C3_9PEZI|nr:hypothetical protein F5X68DRAFT_252896 [Plectosphaerella plurivora]